MQVINWAWQRVGFNFISCVVFLVRGKAQIKCLSQSSLLSGFPPNFAPSLSCQSLLSWFFPCPMFSTILSLSSSLPTPTGKLGGSRIYRIKKGGIASLHYDSNWIAKAHFRASRWRCLQIGFPGARRPAKNNCDTIPWAGGTDRKKSIVPVFPAVCFLVRSG